jgi:glycosyltransferase involved in cell wall biosynthesis
MMRVVFVLPTVGMSGGIKVVAIYARLLSRRGHEVVLVSPPSRNVSFKSKIKGFLMGRGWPVAARPKSHLYGQELDHRVLESWRPIVDGDVPDADVVVATWWETAEWVAGLSESKGAKVYLIQGYEIFDHLPVHRCKATYRLPMHKIVVSNWLKEIMVTQYSSTSVDLVPNGVDMKQFFSPPRDRQAVPTIGFLYSSASLKGVSIVLSAIAEVRKRFPNIRVVCFGSEQPRAAEPLPEGTEFLFSPPQDQIRSIYGCCDVWVTASRSEGFNLPAMEAMACRTPVVATKTGWPYDNVKDSENGFLCDIDSIPEIVKGIESVLLLSNDQWRKMSARAYLTVEHCTWDRSVAMLEAALDASRQTASRGDSGKLLE